MTEEVLARFLTKVHRDIRTGCWLWTAQVGQKSGHGRFKVNGRPAEAHRVAYEHWIGPPPPELHHSCLVARCVNPWHLEPMDHAEHARLSQAAWTHCHFCGQPLPTRVAS